jgi:hypothetical protein
MTVRFASLLMGGVWGLIAWGLGRQAYGPAIWGGVVAAPFIGLLVGGLLHPRFEGTSGWRRWLVALFGLYLGATLFALAVGVTDALTGSPSRGVFEVILQAVIGTWWGVTVAGFWIALWPLAWLTHIVLAWIDDLSPGRSPP